MATTQIITLKLIVDALRDISIQDRAHFPDHLQISSFGFGEQSNINELEVDGVLMWLTPSPSDINKTITTYRFEMIILDLLDNADSNVVDVMSDTAQIVADIIKRLSIRRFKEDYGFSINKVTSPEPTIGNYAQKMAGWSTVIEFEVFNGALCNTAFASSITPAVAVAAKYYIAADTDIYGVGMANLISSSSDEATYSEIVTNNVNDLAVDDKVYIGYSNSTILTGSTVTAKPNTKTIRIDYNTCETDGYSRFAKLTSFTTATYGTAYSFVQATTAYLTYTGADLSTELGIGTIIRITRVDGTIFYDIVEDINFKTGVNSLTPHMRLVTTGGALATIEAMTNIV